MSDQANTSVVLLLALWIAVPLVCCAVESRFGRDRSRRGPRPRTSGRRLARHAVTRSAGRRGA